MQVPWPMGLGHEEGRFNDPTSMALLQDMIPKTADGRAVHFVEVFVGMCRHAYSYNPEVFETPDSAYRHFITGVAADFPSIYQVLWRHSVLLLLISVFSDN